jgi:hypothetical protein
MDYKIKFTDGTTEIIQIIATSFKKLNVWKLSFAGGKEIMLYKVGSEWLQRTEDCLEECYLISIGAYIDRMSQPQI